MCVSSLSVLYTFSLLCLLLSSIVTLSLFFFFKQKTAYEMRISDWSSDVCSSDLIIVNRSRAGRKPSLQRDGCRMFEPFACDLVGRGLGQRGEFKIGRASCRERVCQYV